MKRASQENGPKPHQELLNEPPTETGEELAEIYNNKKLPKRYENVSKVKRERVEKVLEAVLKGSPIREACAMVGMSVSTFHQAFKEATAQAIAVKADVGNMGDLPGLVDACLDAFGKVDILYRGAHEFLRPR